VTAGVGQARRLAFGRVAGLYDEVRPSYPGALIESVLAFAGLGRQDRILEVGAGTGKATRLFAARGTAVVALEPSAQMASVARRRCAAFRSVTIVESDFEHWEAEPEAFKLVAAGQAWHWTDPRTRYRIARRALVEGGTLAAFWNRPDWSLCPLRPALVAAYTDAAPAWPPSGPMHPMVPAGHLVRDWPAEIDAAVGFEEAEVRSYAWAARYTPEQYVQLLSTHSDHIVLEPSVRRELLDGVASAIRRHGGVLELPYVTRLGLARAR
jgi:SAM-dependent methyltransferase